MKILTLKEFGEDRFLDELKKLKELNSPADARNKDWFDILPHTYKKYEDWFFILDDNDNPMFWTSIQKYYSGCYRIFTRSYRYIEHRRFKKKCEPTLSKDLIPIIIDSIENYDTLFMSMQQPRRHALEQYGKSIGWDLYPNLMQTCDNQKNKDCWQNVIYTGIEPLLREMTISEWNNKYAKQHRIL